MIGSSDLSCGLNYSTLSHVHVINFKLFSKFIHIGQVLSESSKKETLQPRVLLSDLSEHFA